MSNPKRTLGLLGVLALTISACSSGGSASSAPASTAPSAAAPSAAASAPASAAAEPVTIDWWHIATGDPGKADFAAIAKAYETAHPNVKIKITVTENEAFKTKLSATPADAYPDLFQSWGGGTMAAQADAGLLQDITAAVAPWKDTVNAGAMSIYQYKGVQYGIPWDMGMIGFWYNKDIFQKAGITPPTTMGRVPRRPPEAQGGRRGPARHRGQGQVAVDAPLDLPACSATAAATRSAKMIQTGDWNTDACIKAGKAVLALNALDPYQKGYASADYNSEAASVGNGKAAMELMGQWAPSVQKDQSIGKKGLGDKLGWFAFPTVTGGAGAATDGVGGGNGIAVEQERAARGDRLPEVLHEQGEPGQAQHRRRRPLDDRRHGEHGHRPEPAGRPRRSRRGDVHAALPGPGDERAAGCRVQRRHRGAVPRQVDPREGLPGPHGRGAKK